MTGIESVAEAHARLKAWLAEGDKPQKIHLRAHEDELMLMWKAWAVCTKLLGRRPNRREFVKAVGRIPGGAELLDTEKKQCGAHQRMIALHTYGPWVPEKTTPKRITRQNRWLTERDGLVKPLLTVQVQEEATAATYAGNSRWGTF